VGADPHTGKNVGVALAPIVRILFGAKTVDPVDETIPDSSDYLYEERTYDDFIAVPRRKKVSKKNYAIADNGKYTVSFVPDSYWADYQDDDFDPDELYIPPVPEAKEQPDFCVPPRPRKVTRQKSWVVTSPNGSPFHTNRTDNSYLLGPYRTPGKVEEKPKGGLSQKKSSDDSQKSEPLRILLDRVVTLCEKLSDTQCVEPQQNAPKSQDIQKPSNTSEDGSSKKNSRRQKKKA
jgi:hypothetical protein